MTFQYSNGNLMGARDLMGAISVDSISTVSVYCGYRNSDTVDNVDKQWVQNLQIWYPPVNLMFVPYRKF